MGLIAPFTRILTQGKSGFAKHVIDGYFKMIRALKSAISPIHSPFRNSTIPAAFLAMPDLKMDPVPDQRGHRKFEVLTAKMSGCASNRGLAL